MNATLPTNEQIQSSIEILRQTMASSVVYLLAGLVACATSTLSLSAIHHSKEMKSKFYALYAEMAVADFLMGFVFLIVTTKKIFRFLTKTGDAMTRYRCCLESAPMYFCQTLGLYVAFTLAIDRTVSFLKPVKYKYMKARHITYPLIGAAWSLSVMETIIMIIIGLEQRNKIEIVLTCNTASCWSIKNYFITLYSHLCVSFFVVFLNFSLMGTARRLMIEAQKRKGQKIVSEEDRHHRSQSNFQLKVIKTLSVMVFSHGTSHISARVILVVVLHEYLEDPEIFLTGFVSPQGSFARNLIVINAALHFFFYYLTSSEFKKAVNDRLAHHFVCCRGCLGEDAVTSIASKCDNFLSRSKTKVGGDPVTVIPVATTLTVEQQK
uniref:G-protein coupled receptors family 1 profile domain-containing protein n=1 Tax=Romanomermis culicivorax TaxID=13658 RepID=A0A915KD20_ROMCU